MRSRILLLVLVVLAPALAAAQTTGIGLPEITVTCDGGALHVTPSGLGPTLESVGATVTVEILDASFEPVVGYPFQDVWIEGTTTNGGFVICPGGTVADDDTDTNGITTISGAMAAGGWARNGLVVVVAGSPVSGPALPLEVNSPDVSGDLAVDLTDVALFASDYASGYAFRSDFTHDGQLNLADVGRMIEHVGERCP